MQDLIKNIKAIKDFFNDTEKSFCIFGAGKHSEQVLDSFRRRNLRVEYFCDNNSKKIGNNIQNVPVKPAKALTKSDHNVLIIARKFNEILEQLDSISFKGNVCVSDPWFSMFDEELYPEETIRQIQWFFSSLADHESKEILRSLFMARSGNSNPKKCSYPQYFHPKIPVYDKGVYIDGGAFNGDTIRTFESLKYSHLHVISFEPDPNNFSSLTNQASKSSFPVIPVKRGLWSRIDRLTFESSEKSIAAGCSILESGDIDIDVTSIDDYVAFNGLKPDFIKLDIESAEIEAIRGAKNTIQKHMPNLAICIYHKYQHLWQIPIIISEYCDDYKLYLGHHSNDWNETVLYASCNPEK